MRYPYYVFRHDPKASRESCGWLMGHGSLDKAIKNAKKLQAQYPHVVFTVLTTLGGTELKQEILYHDNLCTQTGL